MQDKKKKIKYVIQAVCLHTRAPTRGLTPEVVGALSLDWAII